MVATFDFEHAMCVYLGGDRRSGGIQIGYGNERLRAAYGDCASEIKAKLDLVLDAADSYVPDGQSLTTWLATELPSLSSVCRMKIEAHVIYRQTH